MPILPIQRRICARPGSGGVRPRGSSERGSGCRGQYLERSTVGGEKFHSTRRREPRRGDRLGQAADARCVAEYSAHDLEGKVREARKGAGRNGPIGYQEAAARLEDPCALGQRDTQHAGGKRAEKQCCRDDVEGSVFEGKFVPDPLVKFGSGAAARAGGAMPAPARLRPDPPRGEPNRPPCGQWRQAARPCRIRRPEDGLPIRVRRVR